MPAYTITQIEVILGKYVESNALTFNEMMAQVLPRMYSMGMWPDLVYEVSLSGERGYVSLPLDTAGVLACTVNDRPRPTRSMWHDVRISGRSASLSAYYGIVDDGYHPVLIDLQDIPNYDTEAGVVLLRAYNSGSQQPATTLTGVISIVTDTIVTGSLQTLTQDVEDFEGSDEFTCIKEIRYDNVNIPVDLMWPDELDYVVATIPAGSGVLRFRRFRTPEKSASCMVHLLLKRDAPRYIGDDTVVHLGNIGAIKNAMLAIIDEDSADRTRAKDSWAEVEKILDEELQAVMGSAKPTLRLDFGPCPPIQNIM